jgi:integrase
MAAKLIKTKTPSVYRRGGRYVVTYRDAEGRQRWESAPTYDEARRLKARRSHQVDTGELQRETRVRFASYAREWVERYQGRGRRGFRDGTRDEYRRDLARYLIPYLDGRLRRTVGQITPRDVANLIAWLCDDEAQRQRHADERAARDRENAARRERGEKPLARLAEEPALPLADATVRRILSPLRACLGTAMREGIIRHNPCVDAALPSRDEQRAIDAGDDHEEEDVRALTREQLAAFLAIVHSEWRVFFRVLAVSGLRISEAVALRWRDLELDGSRPCVKVRRAYVRGRFGPPKSRYGRRSVPVDAELVDALRARRKGTEWPGDDDLVFPSQAGTPMQQENLRRRILAPAAQEVGAGWAGFHAFRHTCASMLFADGRNAVQVQRWLGHHSPAFTLSVYVHLLDGDLGAPLDLSAGRDEGANGVQTPAPCSPVESAQETEAVAA